MFTVQGPLLNKASIDSSSNTCLPYPTQGLLATSSTTLDLLGRSREYGNMVKKKKEKVIQGQYSLISYLLRTST